MFGSRLFGAGCAAVLVSSLGALAGCSAESDTNPESHATAQTVQAASVSLAAFDENGVKVAEGSGIMISARVVLTAGHLIAGKARWTVTTSSGTKQANGVRGMTYDWMNYESDKSHPRKHDVGVIYLDRPISLPFYPKVSAEELPSGSQATRVRGGFQQVTAKLGKFKTFPHAYVTEMTGNEHLVTGGAVVNSAFEIIGVASGRGKTTGMLHIAQTSDLTTWLSPKIACGNKSSKGLSVRTYETPGDDDDDAGTGSSGSGTPNNGSSGTPSGNNGSSGTPSNGSAGTPNGSADSPEGGADGVPSSCNDGGGGYNADGTPNPSTGSGASPSDKNGTSGTSNASNSTGDDDDDSSSSTGTGSNGGTPTGSNGGTPTGSNGGTPTGSNGTSGTNGSSSTNGSTGSGTPSGSTGTGSGTNPDGTSSSSGSGTNSSSSTNNGSSDGDVEACTGPTDNADVCPPEPNGCTGSSCGGGAPDETVDYGGCDSCKSSDGKPSLH